MRLVEYLIYILEAHAQTLQRLAALVGEEILLELLEMQGEKLENAPKIPVNLSLFEAAHPDAGGGYAELEGAVRDFRLSAVLQFHLWAYPHYRAYIESSLDLNSRIPGPGGDAGSRLADEAVTQAKAWIKALPLPSMIALQAERAAEIPWLRFRSEVLKRIGKRPLGPVY